MRDIKFSGKGSDLDHKLGLGLFLLMMIQGLVGGIAHKTPGGVASGTKSSGSIYVCEEEEKGVIRNTGVWNRMVDDNEDDNGNQSGNGRKNGKKRADLIDPEIGAGKLFRLKPGCSRGL